MANGESTGQESAPATVETEAGSIHIGSAEAVIDQLGLFSVRAVLRTLLLLWFVPASVQFVMGVSAVFSLPAAAVATDPRNLRLLWAGMVLLAVPTILISAIWLVRQLFGDNDCDPGGTLTGSRFHRWAAVVAIVTLGAWLVARWAGLTVDPALVIVPATACFAALLAVARWLASLNLAGAYCLGLVTGIVGFELSIGWFHLVTTAAPAMALLAVEGLTLAFTSATSVRALRSKRIPNRSVEHAGSTDLRLQPLRTNS